MKLYRYYKKNKVWILYDVQEIDHNKLSIIYFKDIDTEIQCKDVIK